MADASTSEKVVALYPPEKHSEKKWGRSVMSHGYTILPSMLLQAQQRLTLSPQEMIVLLHLVDHWWKPEGKVFPSKATLSDRVGLSTKQVQRHVKRLEELRLVQRKARFSGGRQISNEYNLSGLVKKLKSIEVDISKAKKLTVAAATRPGGLTGALAKT